MTHSLIGVFLVTVLWAALAVPGGRPAAAVQGGQSEGWRIPAGAEAEASPIPVTPAVLASGRDIFRGRCARCHGPGGRGDGPDSDPDRKPVDLTDGSRAARNPDGVMFYKVWNGRNRPKMPAFSADLSREEVWTVVHYVKTLRK